jgi:uncharacterized ion transporter superfamily protein YfcC
MEQQAGAQISKKAFIQSFLILLVLMLLSGILTLIVPAGSFERTIVDGRETILPDTFTFVDPPAYPIWRWATAPIEALFAPDGLTVVIIVLFILLVGASFAVIDSAGILRQVVTNLVRKFEGQKYILLLAITFFFMALGATFGIFEEVVPLIPLLIALSLSMGWDSLVGLGMSILATNMGFSAAIANPFTIGIAQQIAGVPLFSGAILRIAIFFTFYLVLAVFLVRYAKRIEANPSYSRVYQTEEGKRQAVFEPAEGETTHLQRSIGWFLSFVVLILAMLIVGPILPPLSGFLLPIVGLLFLMGGLGAGFLSGLGFGKTMRAAWQGVLGILPGVPLILMAVSSKHIIQQAGILDTLMYRMSQPFLNVSPLLAVAAVFAITLILEIFVASGSAKAFLLMPLLLPLAELVGITRQTLVQAYVFGDGFSNMAYPTNPVLLISLGLTVVSYPVWIRWTYKLWLVVLCLAAAFLGLAVAIGYGPF